MTCGQNMVIPLIHWIPTWQNYQKKPWESIFFHSLWHAKYSENTLPNEGELHRSFGYYQVVYVGKQKKNGSSLG